MSRRRIASCAATGLRGTFAFIEAPVENKGRACCNDCGVDTAPMRKRKLGRWETGRWEWYSVHSSVWAQAGMEPHGGFLCIGCLETRLGRQLCQDDFPPARVNQPSDLDTPRLRSRRRAADPAADGGTQ